VIVVLRRPPRLSALPCRELGPSLRIRDACEAALDQAATVPARWR